MRMEIDLLSERQHTPFVTFSTEEDTMSLGLKVWGGKPGQFKYEWLLEEMDLVELVSLHEALTFALDRMTEGDED
jgi:hypothetical protein